MFNLKIFLVVLGAMLFLVGGQSWGRVEDTTTHHSYEHFRISPTDFTWQQCRDSAIVLRGHLATITSQEEFEFVISLFLDTVRASWLGGTDEAQEGVWQWITGEPWSYTRWAPGEPNNNGDEDYVYMRRAGQPLDNWNDHKTLLPGENFLVEWDCCVVAGDANHDREVNIADATFLIKYIFGDGSAPVCNDEADADAGGDVNVGDAIFIVKYIFQRGSAPICGTTGM